MFNAGTIARGPFPKDTYVAVGPDNSIYTSNDSLTWVSRTSPMDSDGSIATVFTGNGVIVAANSKGQLCTSDSKGITWTLRTLSVGGQQVTCGAYGNGLYVVCAGNKQVAYSSDSGVTWTTAASTLPLGTSSGVAIAFLDGKFCIGSQASASFPTGAFHTSTDGENWTSHEIDSAYRGVNFQVSSVNDTWIAAGGTASGLVLTSTDAETWTLLGDASEIFGVSEGFTCPLVYRNESYVGFSTAADSKIATSPDASVWTQQTKPDARQYRWSITDETQALVFGGATGNLGNIMRSSNLTDWTVTTGHFLVIINGACYLNNRLGP